MMPVQLDGIVNIGSSGAPTLVSSQFGIASVSRSAAGKYTITLSDGFASLLAVRVRMQSKDASNPSGIASVEMVTSDVVSAKTINIVCLAPAVTMASYTPAGTITNGTPDTFSGTPAVLTGTMSMVAADPISGSAMIIEILVNNSSTQ